jgi:hypothetical protein
LNAYDGRVETYSDYEQAKARSNELQTDLTAYADKIQHSCSNYPAINFDGMKMTLKYTDTSSTPPQEEELEIELTEDGDFQIDGRRQGNIFE